MADRPSISEPGHARLLLAILRESWTEVERTLAGGAVDPGTFISLARECDVHPWVHARLKDTGRLGLFGSEIERGLAEARRKVGADNLLLLARTERALEALSEAGIVPIVLKGLDLMHRLYDRFDERTLDDVDILVRRDELDRTIDALVDAGWGAPDPALRKHYAEASHHLPLPSPGPVPVEFEIHWNLVQIGRYDLDVEGLFRRAVPLEVAGRRVLRLDDDDSVAHLLLHHFTHYFDRRLKWAIDLRALLEGPGTDWDTVARRIREWRAGSVVGMSVLHLHKLFPEWLPDGIRRMLPVSWWRRALAAPLRSSHPLDLLRSTRRRGTQLYLAAVLLENPLDLPGWMLHRLTRQGRPGG